MLFTDIVNIHRHRTLCNGLIEMLQGQGTTQKGAALITARPGKNPDLSERGVGEGFAHLVVAEAAVALELAVIEELVEG
jgi:hypothetical protein